MNCRGRRPRRPVGKGYMFALRTCKERSDGLASLPSVYARFTGSICLLRKLDIRFQRSICPAGVRDVGEGLAPPENLPLWGRWICEAKTDEVDEAKQPHPPQAVPLPQRGRLLSTATCFASPSLLPQRGRLIYPLFNPDATYR